MSTLPVLPDDLLYVQQGAVATITLNRPDKLNTMTPAMGKALMQLVSYINSEESIRVVVLTGSGSKAFSAGSDIKVLDEYGSNWQLRKLGATALVADLKWRLCLIFVMQHLIQDLVQAKSNLDGMVVQEIPNCFRE
jgi:enoyl-CoA hydratase/carnithine racemase